jgi:hypothetical protein
MKEYRIVAEVNKASIRFAKEESSEITIHLVNVVSDGSGVYIPIGGETEFRITITQYYERDGKLIFNGDMSWLSRPYQAILEEGMCGKLKTYGTLNILLS